MPVTVFLIFNPFEFMVMLPPDTAWVISRSSPCVSSKRLFLPEIAAPSSIPFPSTETSVPEIAASMSTSAFSELISTVPVPVIVSFTLTPSPSTATLAPETAEPISTSPFDEFISISPVAVIVPAVFTPAASIVISVPVTLLLRFCYSRDPSSILSSSFIL